MKVWSEENGAADGNLDTTLAASRGLRRDTRKYIVSISQTLTERLINAFNLNLGEAGNKSVSVLRSLTAAVSEGNNDDSSDSGFGDPDTDSVNDILEDLKVDTTCLLDLEPLLCHPILQTDSEPTAALDASRIAWSPHQPYSDKVSVRFPMAADALVNRLGKANYERYLRCQEQKATNELGIIPPDQADSGGLDTASSKFHDSGIGSSLPTTSSAYAETVMSYGMGEGRKVRVPPLPNRAKEGLPFSCVACGRLVKIATDSAWKKHVYGDLQPWVCLEADYVFANDTFPARTDWISHLALHHEMGPEWRMVECSLCRIEIGPGKFVITKHLGNHLEEISLAALPADCEPDDESSDASRDDSENDLNSTRELDDETGDLILSTSDDVYPGRDGGQSPTKSKIYNPYEEFWNHSLDHPNELHSTGRSAEGPATINTAEIPISINDAESPAIPTCTICYWAPDTSVHRSEKKMRVAVEKHIKRNHQAQDFTCPICYQRFRNRPDNVKSHVRRKHPQSFDSLYPKKAPGDGQQDQGKKSPKNTMGSQASGSGMYLKLLLCVRRGNECAESWL